MKKTIRFLSLILAFIMILSVFTACGNTGESLDDKNGSKNSLIGKWEYKTLFSYNSYVFEEDGTGYFEYYLSGLGSKRDFTYTKAVNKIILEFVDNKASVNYNYIIKGDCLNISDDFGSYISLVRNGGKGEEPSARELKNIFGIEVELSDLLPQDKTESLSESKVYPAVNFPTSFSAEETAKMSNFMTGGYYTSVGDTVYGLLYSEDGTSNFAKFEVVTNDGLTEFRDINVIMPKTAAKYVTYHEGYVYFVNPNGGLYKVAEDQLEAEKVSGDVYGYFSIYNNQIYYCDANNYFCKCELDGTGKKIIIDKEVYYPYCLTDEWVVYQDDADGESLYIYNMADNTDIKLTDTHAYCPIIYDSSMYVAIAEEKGGEKKLAKFDLSTFCYTYDSETGKYLALCDTEISKNVVTGTFLITEDGKLNNGKEAEPIENWISMDNPEGEFELLYRYTSADYDIYWTYDNSGYVENVNIHCKNLGNIFILPLI